MTLVLLFAVAAKKGHFTFRTTIEETAAVQSMHSDRLCILNVYFIFKQYRLFIVRKFNIASINPQYIIKIFIFIEDIILKFGAKIPASAMQSRTFIFQTYTVVWSDYKFYRQMLWFFFHPHLLIKSKASVYMSRHLHIESKTSAYTIGTCFRFYMQMPLDI